MDEATAVPVTVPVPVPTAPLKRILLVEDEKPYLHALQLKLQKAGYEVVGLNNGIGAMEILKKERFDLMILDIVMPDINGFVIMDDLRERQVVLPTIILSNLSQEEDKQKIASYGVKAFIEKANCTIVDVIQKVQEQFISSPS